MEFILVHSSKLQSIIWVKSRWQQLEAASHITYSQEQRINAVACLLVLG